MVVIRVSLIVGTVSDDDPGRTRLALIWHVGSIHNEVTRSRRCRKSNWQMAETQSQPLFRRGIGTPAG
jgi:hypothetical protein